MNGNRMRKDDMRAKLERTFFMPNVYLLEISH
jgi:hypothetical protein